MDSWERYGAMSFDGLSLVLGYGDYYHNDFGFLEIHNSGALGQSEA